MQGIGILQVVLFLVPGVYFLVMVYLSIKKKFYIGMILPGIWLCIALYYIMQPIPVPEPPAKPMVPIESFYILISGSLSIIGFVILFLTKIVMYIGNRIKTFRKD